MGLFSSSTKQVPPIQDLPQHVAVIMDGNGRWAKKRFLPRVAGHQRGLESVRALVKACVRLDIQYLTLFAFSSENWRRPPEEVTFLMSLFLEALDREVRKLHEANVILKLIGDRSSFNPTLQQKMLEAEQQTAGNTGLTLTIAVNYGGRWDVVHAFNQLLKDKGAVTEVTESDLTPYLSMPYAPEPDLFIRTGGETRISNFLLWQLAYTELYFTPTLWPDFDDAAFEAALTSYQQRERRFGRTSEQLSTDSGTS
ncbi:polyprenyl diphosphate synthase [Methylophilus medardicus]|uniref:Isoprenyl transferase n=1 Tax=Methylophilus medardicus TaxID=2588534 RepID=A0A5B8CRF9_9PROT|nr:polyprenyl diphosphate synthase [Methylophilus medardicus]QDC43858.1 di-trans,poly-cis-decaprenylcistransferase [Methylophilus medardicus]QDC48865.1 di-trans,poly-cis-decaprenylcistransferase [Methylophilus medardicus]QDC52570.1 di-trans,poly-cis-decaprenylcistransferase [Methylophilus medardicus]